MVCFFFGGFRALLLSPPQSPLQMCMNFGGVDLCTSADSLRVILRQYARQRQNLTFINAGRLYVVKIKESYKEKVDKKARELKQKLEPEHGHLDVSPRS